IAATSFCNDSSPLRPALLRFKRRQFVEFRLGPQWRSQTAWSGDRGYPRSPDQAVCERHCGPRRNSTNCRRLKRKSAGRKGEESLQKLVAAIEKFVPRSEIDERYLDSPYYLTPENKVGQDAFAVIREAMRRKGMVGLGKVVISRRERIVMLEPFEQGLMATTLRYAYEVRDARPYFEDIPPVKLPDEMVKLAEHILETKAGHFNPAEFDDRYETAVVEMLKQKQAGMPPRKEAAVRPPSSVVKLMDALRR